MTAFSTNVTTGSSEGKEKASPLDLSEDEFLFSDDLVGIRQQSAERSLKRSICEIEELIREKKWEDIVSLFHPVEEKFPEVAEQDMETPVRAKEAFALGQIKQFDEAIAQLVQCIEKEPG